MDIKEATEYLASKGARAVFYKVSGEPRVYVETHSVDGSEIPFSATATNIELAVEAMKKDIDHYLANRNRIYVGRRHRHT